MFANGINSWRSKIQNVVAQITTDAEYTVLTFAVKEAIWIKKLNCMDRMVDKIFTISIKEDNKKCFPLSRNIIKNDRSKHMNTKYQFFVDMIQRKVDFSTIRSNPGHNSRHAYQSFTNLRLSRFVSKYYMWTLIIK